MFPQYVTDVINARADSFDHSKHDLQSQKKRRDRLQKSQKKFQSTSNIIGAVSEFQQYRSGSSSNNNLPGVKAPVVAIAVPTTQPTAAASAPLTTATRAASTHRQSRSNKASKVVPAARRQLPTIPPAPRRDPWVGSSAVLSPARPPQHPPLPTAALGRLDTREDHADDSDNDNLFESGSDEDGSLYEGEIESDLGSVIGSDDEGEVSDGGDSITSELEFCI
jgi:hypothetical protein